MRSLAEHCGENALIPQRSRRAFTVLLTTIPIGGGFRSPDPDGARTFRICSSVNRRVMCWLRHDIAASEHGHVEDVVAELCRRGAVLERVERRLAGFIERDDLALG
jgi:hypothetical protein